MRDCVCSQPFWSKQSIGICNIITLDSSGGGGNDAEMNTDQPILQECWNPWGYPRSGYTINELTPHPIKLAAVVIVNGYLFSIKPPTLQCSWLALKSFWIAFGKRSLHDKLGYGKIVDEGSGLPLLKMFWVRTKTLEPN